MCPVEREEGTLAIVPRAPLPRASSRPPSGRGMMHDCQHGNHACRKILQRVPGQEICPRQRPANSSSVSAVSRRRWLISEPTQMLVSPAGGLCGWRTHDTPHPPATQPPSHTHTHTWLRSRAVPCRRGSAIPTRCRCRSNSSTAPPPRTRWAHAGGASDGHPLREPLPARHCRFDRCR